MTTFFVPGNPRPWSAPTTGKGGGFSKPELVAWERLVRQVALLRGRRVNHEALEVALEFRMSRDSMAKKVRQQLVDQKNLPHTRTPDIDNLTKAVLDGLRYKRARANSKGQDQVGIILDDSTVAHVDAWKFWADEGETSGVHITIREFGG